MCFCDSAQGLGAKSVFFKPFFKTGLNVHLEYFHCTPLKQKHMFVKKKTIKPNVEKNEHLPAGGAFSVHILSASSNTRA